MAFPPLMRTGMSSLESSSGALDRPDSFIHKLFCMVAALGMDAARSAGMYAEHANAMRVSKETMLMALKHTARTILRRDDLEKLVLQAEQAMLGSSDDDGSESESGEHDGDESVHATCECECCKAFRHAVDTWDQWEPEDEAEAFLKKHVNAAVERENRIT